MRFDWFKTITLTTIIILLATLSFATSLESVEIQTDKDTVEVPGTVQITGEAKGDGLNSMRVERKTSSGDWTSVGTTRGCTGSSCSIERDYSKSSEGEETFRIKAATDDGETKESSEKTVKFIEKQDQPKIDNIDISVNSQQIKTPGTVDIKGEADGKELEKLEIQRKTSSSDWTRIGTSKTCTGSSCSIERDYSKSSEGEETFTAKAYAGDDKKRSSEITVDWIQEDDEKQGPEADLKIDPSDAKINENIEFDASGSTQGDRSIEEYWFDFKNDGEWDRKTSRDTVSENFGEEFDGRARLKIIDKADKTDQTTARYSVSEKTEQKVCGISEDSITNLNLDEDRIEKGSSTEASLNIENTGDDQKVTVEFRADGTTYGKTTKTIEENRDKTFSAEVSPERDTNVLADIRTKDDPCGTKSFDRTQKLTVFQPKEQDKDAELKVNTKNTEGKTLEDVRVRADSTEQFTDSTGSTSFTLTPGTYTIKASKDGYKTKNREVSLSKKQLKEITLNLEKKEEDKGKFTAIVRDTSDNRLEDAKVELENTDKQTKKTDRHGRATFYLEPDKYDINVSKDNYKSSTDSIRIRSGDDRTRNYYLEKEEDDRDRGLKISEMNYPDKVCKGDTLDVDVKVENLGGYHEVVTLTGSGLGQTTVSNSFSLSENQTEERTFRFTNVQGDGDTEFKLTATNRQSDSKNGTVNVENCPKKGVDSEVREITAELKPREVIIGQPVKVRGHVRGVRGSTTVTIDIDREEKAQVKTDRDGYYSTHIRPDKIGEQTVTISAGDRSTSRKLNVLATSNVGSINAPKQVFEGEKFEVCAEVTSEATPKVFFEKNDRVLQTVNDKGELCFEDTAKDPGEHTYSIRSITHNQESRASTQVEVLERRSEAETFPDRFATVRSGSGIVKVDLYNNNREIKEYDVSIEGIDEKWVTQSSKEAIIRPGEPKAVYFYFTPRAEGEFRPEIQVDKEGETVYTEEIIMEIQGTSETRKTSWRSRIRGFFRL